VELVFTSQTQQLGPQTQVMAVKATQDLESAQTATLDRVSLFFATQLHLELLELLALHQLQLP
jgi:hypothetical protein